MLNRQQTLQNDRFASKFAEFSALVGAFRAYVSPIIAITGILGNGLIIYLFWREKPRTRFSVFAISLALAHTISLVINTIMDDFLGRGLHYATGGAFSVKLDATSEASCKLLEYLPNTMYFTASYLVAVFSIDRVLTTYHPIRFHACRYRKQAILACLIVAILGASGNIPTLFVQTLRLETEGNIACRMDRSRALLADFAIVFTTIVTFFLPVIIVLVLNLIIIQQLWRAHRWRTTMTGGARGAQGMGRITGHLAMTTCFLLLYLPLGIVVLMRLHVTVCLGEENTPRAIRIINMSKFLSSLKDVAYAVNCLIYAIFLPKFRARLTSLCGYHRPHN
ncbi:Neuropeptide S receptor [Echinococcus granulosus]|uniref:Neuropeptide S receptor n=1 Tax=Echinococcus granulosus TaxID=6210 RepID=W6U7H8_ECHGR|nr:Neuropeptide S receptor [Echinococcus granulosus]EUB56316.1 Neuropeptide S receptor [Echinococcus granulosus]